MKQASDLATQSMDRLYQTLTHSFIEQMTMKEEQLTERALTQLLVTLKDTKRTFIEVFSGIIYDVKESSTELTKSPKPKFHLVENQYMLD
jgi:hypothetical protein